MRWTPHSWILVALFLFGCEGIHEPLLQHRPCPHCETRGVVACRHCHNGILDCRNCLEHRGCIVCSGDGKVECLKCAGRGDIPCPDCGGTGSYWTGPPPLDHDDAGPIRYSGS